MKIRAIKLLSISLLVASLFLTGCKDNYEASRATYWPSLKMLGDEFMVINVGDPFSDPGAEASIGGATVPYDVEDLVDPNTIGIYTITYSAANEDGISAIQTRTVAVVSPTAIAQPEVVGNYTLSAPARPAPIPTMTVSEVAPALYFVTSIYGSNGSNQLITVPAYIYTEDGTNFTVMGGSMGGNAANGGTAVWNSITGKLACSFNIASVGPSTLFSRTWAHN